MEFNPSADLLGTSKADHKDSTSAVTLFLSSPQPSAQGLVTPMVRGHIDFTILESVLSYQLGLPLNPDLSNIQSTLMPVLSTLYERLTVAPNAILAIIEKYIARYTSAPTPRLMSLSHHQRAFVDALLHYSLNHAIVSAHHLAAQSHFQQLARNAFLDEILQSHYYQYTGLLALIERLEDNQKEMILSTIHDQNTVLRSAAASFLNDDVFIGAAAVWQHYIDEVSYGAPLSRLDTSDIFLGIKETLNR